MNSLSWLLFCAGLVDKFHDLLDAFLFICLFAGAIFLINMHDLGNSISFALYKLKPYFFGFIVLLLINILVPSKETIYAIAVSEFGEQIVNRKIVVKSESVLEKWFDSQIKEEK